MNFKLKCLAIGGESFPIKCSAIEKLIMSGVKVLNLYGVTEMSCWSTCYLVNKNDIEDDNVCIGTCLSETELFIKFENGNLQEINDQLLADSFSKKFEGVLFISSSTRVCYINGKKEEYLNSADLVRVLNARIYVMGRSDNSVKINGKLTDLTKIEKVGLI